MRRRRDVLLFVLLLLAIGAVPAAAAPAKISLVREADDDGATRFVATVTDAAGAAVKNTAVSFSVRTAFGWLRVAEMNTDAGGKAVLQLDPTMRYAELLAQSEEEPDVRAGLRLAQVERPEPIRRPGPGVLRALSPQPGFVSPYPPVQILFVAVLLGGIWTTYAYLVLLLARIRRAQ